jgi:signal transduction histidine kinase
MSRSQTHKSARVTQKAQQKIPESGQASTLSVANAANTSEEQLRNDLEKLEQANKVQRGFISVVSHEFRTTLAGIQGFSELLRDREMNTAKTQEFATIIYNDARRLDAVISDLLDLERMMAGQLTLNLEEVDLSALLTQAAEKAQELTLKHTLHLKFEQPLVPMIADRELLQQLSNHLFSNAVNYSPDGGEVWVGAQITAGMVHMVFHDQGVGIPPESLEEIFIPFRRLKNPQTRTVKGAGLGLSLVQQIVLLHHGKIWIESTPGEGSTIHVSFPWIDPAHFAEEEDA